VSVVNLNFFDANKDFFSFRSSTDMSQMPKGCSLTALAVSCDDGKWWYAIPKNQKLSDDWKVCNCTWMKPEPSLPTSFRHPSQPDTPMRWFRHDISQPSQINSYARFGVVTFVGTLDPNNDPMTTRWVWGVSEEDDDEMQAIYSQVLAREVEDKRRRAETERDREGEALPISEDLVAGTKVPPLPAVEGQCIRVQPHRQSSIYYCPEGTRVTFLSGRLEILCAHRICPLEAAGVLPCGKYFVVDPGKPDSVRCATNELEIVPVEWTGNWGDDETSYKVIRTSSQTSLQNHKRQRGDDDRSIADVAVSKIKKHQPLKQKKTPASLPATSIPQPIVTSPESIKAPFSLEDILRRAGEEKARVAAVQP
jgi:hypothetical protein